MEYQTLKIIVAAIVAAALLYIAISYFPQQTSPTVAEIQKALDYAQANEGKLHYKTIYFRNGEAFRGNFFDNASRSARFECNSAQTCAQEKLIIDARLLEAKKDAPQDMYFRCVKKTSIYDCVIYFGEKPAQIEIINANLAQSAANGEDISISFEIKNTGKLNAIETDYEIKIYQIKIEDNQEKQLLRQEFGGTIEKLEENEAKAILQEFAINSSGNYIVKITAKGEDAGSSSSGKKIEIIGSLSQGCRATNTGRTIQETDKTITEHFCQGCVFGYECSSRWIERGINAQSISENVSPEIIYVENEIFNEEWA